MALINGFHHVSLKCKDYEMFEKAVQFYHDLLGLPITRAWGEGDRSAVMLANGTGYMEIMANGMTGDTTGTVNHFALTTKDVDACVETVRNAGYKITTEPRDVVLPANPPVPARIAFCIGPVGEEIEFFDEK